MKHQLTVVMLNWERPANTAKLSLHYSKMAAVRQVIVADCNPKHSQEPFPIPASDNFVYCRFTADTGLVTRFAAAALARTELVLLADDDIVLPEETVNSMLKASLLCNSDHLVGVFGRCPQTDGEYSTANIFGRVPIVLTRAVVAPVILCCAALPHVHAMVADCGGQPYGNGEDIVLSYTAMRQARGHFNEALGGLKYQNAGYDDASAISKRFKGHVEHRTKVVKWCRRRLYNEIT